MTVVNGSDPGSAGQPRQTPGKRLALFLDGTWNDPDANTNVWRLYAASAEVNPADGLRQLRYYDRGVGSGRFDRIRGGVTGQGLEANVREAYQWLVQNFDGKD